MSEKAKTIRRAKRACLLRCKIREEEEELRKRRCAALAGGIPPSRPMHHCIPPDVLLKFKLANDEQDAALLDYIGRVIFSFYRPLAC